MTLIEMLVYIGLLGIILFGSVFSAYSIMYSQEKTQDTIQSIDVDERGFIALITALIISATMMVLVLGNSQKIADIFDQINHKQYRVAATRAALVCLDTVMREFEHDYFFEVKDPGVSYPDSNCSILSVTSVSGDIENPSATRVVSVKGSSVPDGTLGAISARIDAQALINSQNISLVSSAVIF